MDARKILGTIGIVLSSYAFWITVLIGISRIFPDVPPEHNLVVCLLGYIGTILLGFSLICKGKN